MNHKSRNPGESRFYDVVELIVRTIFLSQVMTMVSDQAITRLLGVIRFLLYILSTFLSLDLLKSCCEIFPTTLYSAKKIAGLSITDEMFTKWIACPKCHTLYKIEDSIKIIDGKKVSKK